MSDQGPNRRWSIPLPAELHDHIVDHLWDDRAALLMRSGVPRVPPRHAIPSVQGCQDRKTVSRNS
ncbi:hypothetical protein SCP_1101780 [Sparassis crispa]|uniref:Uncharacterized protein n=1 Tax=Sparassis crispa TaxID=139825 RepID=A0A401GZA8_9APHY|nr:hypothetical protein SCP_1101780 [Sparassis crispa]GBE87501.1 hypothetical protein SCP_1101780 [Sparassis crispa]